MAKRANAARDASLAAPDDTARAAIPTRQIVERLTAFVNGDIKMTAPQVTAALNLLKKSLPDLPQNDANHTVKRGATDYSRDELVAILDDAQEGGGGIAGAPRCGG